MAELNEKDLVNVSGGVYTGSCFRYQIQPGDCLSVLAQRYGTTVAVLCSINNISNPNFIRAYDYLLIPYGTGTTTTTTTTTTNNSGLVYVDIK